jgi:hypothetical protein
LLASPIIRALSITISMYCTGYGVLKYLGSDVL